MLRKLSLGLLGLVLIFGIAYSSDTELSKSLLVAGSSTMNITYVNTSIIIPGQTRILGFTIVPTSTDKPYAGLYNATSVSGLVNGNVLGENSQVAYTSGTTVFPYPKTVSTGLAVLTGVNTNVIIDYSK